MKDRQKIYLDKIVKLLVDDTILDYDKDIMYYPFSSFPFEMIILIQLYSPWPSFSNYCKNQFGLNDEEIDYVWDQYKSIIIGKIKNNER